MDFEKLNKFRVKSGMWSSHDTDEHGLFFIKTMKGDVLKVLSSGWSNRDWYHVSVSLPNRCPTWSEMCMIKDLFFGDVVAIQFHPKKSEYINNHPYCLHLWANMNEQIKTPHHSLVGIKQSTN